MRILFRTFCIIALPLLAACSGGASDSLPDLGGPTVNTIRGTPSSFEPLRPEPGNIWSEGLQAAPAPTP